MIILQPTRTFAMILALLLFSAAKGQFNAPANPKQAAAELALTPLILDESVITEQWPVTLPIVNPPSSLLQLTPGQCVRLGVISTGDESDKQSTDMQIEVNVTFAGHRTTLPLTPTTSIKRIKPEGADFVKGALDAGGVHYQIPHRAVIIASAQRWCVPADVSQSKVKMNVLVVRNNKRTALSEIEIPIISPDQTTSSFKDDADSSQWSVNYYRNPQPERLPAIASLIFEHDESSTIVQQFVISAMKQNPVASRRLGSQLIGASPQIQAMMVKLALEAGIKMEIPFELSPMQKEFVENLPNIPDEYDLIGDDKLFGKLDQLWATFGATGSRLPVETIVSMLAWHGDYDTFAKIEASHKQIKDLTPQIARGVAYTAVGWSLSSFKRTDPLVRDYIDAIMADSKTSDQIKKELTSLDSNPAFKR